MRKKTIIVFLLTSGILCYLLFKKSDIDVLRDQHITYLKNSPFKNTKELSKKERYERGLPPNKYYEQLWELTMDPRTGRPMTENLTKIRTTLKKQRENRKGGGGDTFAPWIERGPYNVGGRTRAIMFDPNDATNKKVFAGGVSGGLWVNNDITNANSSWTLVPGIAGNIAVNVIISDPNNSNTFYIGSGESYVSGDAIGRGIWKSTDAGVTWTHIYGGLTSSTTNHVNGIFYVNDLVARNNNGNTELYASIAGALYRKTVSPNNQFHGLNQQGLYKSTDDGANWNKIILNESNGRPSNPNDLEIDINNNIWLTTTRNLWGFNGGKIFRSTDGSTFSLMHTVPNAHRTELEVSATSANKFWVAVEVNNEVDLYRTTDAFTNVTKLAEPNDADLDISETNYTRNLAYYTLVIEADASDNVYVGGIDLFRSTDEGNSWTQISKWSEKANLNTLNIPLVHADHHAIVFRPGTTSEVVFGTDGGIYYSPDVTAATASLSITPRNNNYNVTQFYYGTIGPSTTNEILFGGTQDNGSIISQNIVSGINSFNNYFGFFSGDGSYCKIDPNGGLVGFGNGEYMVLSTTYSNYRVASPNVTSSTDAMNNGYNFSSTTSTSGSFNNEADLDVTGNILYANTSTSTPAVNKFSGFALGASSATETTYTNALLTSPPSALKVSPYNNNTVFIGTRTGQLLKVTNLNTTPIWTSITGGSFVGSVSDIELGATEQEIFITFHNYGVTNIWHSTNGGTTWSSRDGNLPDFPVKCVLQNPLNTSQVIIGTEMGVWSTSDITATSPVWVQSYNGMSDVRVLDLDLRTADNTILASTYGRGLFTSKFSASNITWVGTTSDWHTTTNWNPNSIPTANNHVMIPASATNNPIISSSANTNNLQVESGASVTLNSPGNLTVSGSLTNNGSVTANSGSSIIVSGASNGNITYKRNISSNAGWFLISSPVAGQDIDAFAAATSLAIGNVSNNRGLGSYNNSTPGWEYYQQGSTGTGNFTSGLGKAVLLTSSEDISFTGTIPTVTRTNISLLTGANNFNLIGNPYPSYVSLNDLLTTNNSLLAEQTAWLWNHSTSSYAPYNLISNLQIAPGQGFFVKASAATNSFGFTEAMQSHQNPDTFVKQSQKDNFNITLRLSNNSIERQTKIYFIDGVSLDWDDGYDSTMIENLSGTNSNTTAIFTRLPTENSTKKLAIQSLPNSNYESTTIPIGITAQDGASLSISAEAFHNASGMELYLEDTHTNSLTPLNKETRYQIIWNNIYNNSNRFFLHMTSSNLSTSYTEKQKVTFFTNSSNILEISGLDKKDTRVRLFNLQGKELDVFKFDNKNKFRASLNHLATGIYLIEIVSDDIRERKKVLIR